MTSARVGTFSDDSALFEDVEAAVPWLFPLSLHPVINAIQTTATKRVMSIFFIPISHLSSVFLIL